MSTKTIPQLNDGGPLTAGDELEVSRSVDGVATSLKAAYVPGTSSVFSRTGNVVAEADDYTIGQISGATALASASSSFILGTYGFYDYLGNAPVASDAIAQLQGFLLACQLKAYALNNQSLALDDQMQRNFLIAEIPRGNYQVSCPLIVPEQVALRCQGTIVRLGLHGTITNAYTGDVTSQALANLVQPTVIVVPNAHILDNLDIYGNSNGSDKGSGAAIGKNWIAISVTPVIPGTGYSVGDVIVFPQVSKAPYFPISVVVTTVNGSGGITGTTLPTAGGSSSVGAYALPPILQQTQWTAANGFTGAIANGSIGQVFDPAHAGYYITRGGAGTGAEFTVNWQPDFSGSGQAYNGGLSLIADTIIENLTATSLGISLDSTYGPMFGTIWSGLNYDFYGQIETTGGYYGTMLNGVADFHGGTLNPVDAQHAGIKILNGGSISFKAIVDSPVNIGIAIDGASQVNVVPGSYGIQFGSNPGITGAAFIVIGGDGIGYASAINIDMSLQNCGSAGTTPAIYLDYLAGANRINLNVSNTNSSNQAEPYPNELFATFGSHIASPSALSLTGSIDRITGAIFSGTIPNCGIDVVDGVAGGNAGRLGTYSLYGTSAPTNGSGGTGAGKAATGSLYMNVTTGTQYRNTGTQASPTWSNP